MEQLRQTVSEVAAQIVDVRPQQMPAETPLASAAEQDLKAPGATSSPPLTRRLLWVDDEPSDNAYEIAALKDREVHVDVALSTEQALRILADDPNYDSVVTDMDRREDDVDQPTAGLTLIRKINEDHPDLPVVLYTSASTVEQETQRALELGAVGATSDPTELLELLAVNYGPRFAYRFEREV